MNIHSAVIEATNVLKDKSILSAQLDTEILMAKALDKDREYIISIISSKIISSSVIIVSKCYHIFN
ncbi:hypothetical protein OAN73_04410 [Candidatus Pelagibacter sp.]|nr:hypothetical protein [Candidatus Pelagibacter sp.]